MVTCRSSWTHSCCVADSSGLLLINWNNFKETQCSEENKTGSVQQQHCWDLSQLSKQLTRLDTQLWAKVELLAQRHEDVDVRRDRPHSAIGGQACSDHLQHTLPARRSSRGTSGPHQPSTVVCVCLRALPRTVTVGRPLNQNTQGLQSSEPKLLQADTTFTQPQQRLQQIILGAQSHSRGLWEQRRSSFFNIHTQVPGEGTFNS